MPIDNVMDKATQPAIRQITEQIDFQADILALCGATWASARPSAETPAASAATRGLAADLMRVANPAVAPLERVVSRLEAICQACVPPSAPIPVAVRAQREY